MKKMMSLAVLLASTEGVFALPAAAEVRRIGGRLPAYTETYNNGYYDHGYYTHREDRRGDRVRVRRDFHPDRGWDRDGWR
jgi:hypothetical protein